MARRRSPRYHCIYIPGLGDGYDGLRRSGLALWQLWGVTTELVPMQWYGGGGFNQRYDAVIAAIDRAQLRGDKVVIIGESAGASMAINVTAHCPGVERLVTICGITNSRAEVSSVIRKRSPSFNEAIGLVDSSLDMLPLEMVCSVRAAVDAVVPKKTSVIPGARQGVVWSVGHLFTVALCLSVCSGYIIHLMRALKKGNNT